MGLYTNKRGADRARRKKHKAEQNEMSRTAARLGPVAGKNHRKIRINSERWTKSTATARRIWALLRGSEQQGANRDGFLAVFVLSELWGPGTCGRCQRPLPPMFVFLAVLCLGEGQGWLRARGPRSFLPAAPKSHAMAGPLLWAGSRTWSLLCMGRAKLGFRLVLQSSSSSLAAAAAGTLSWTRKQSTKKRVREWYRCCFSRSLWK